MTCSCKPTKKPTDGGRLASLIGATIEWYDFFLYGVVAGIVFNKLYFPTAIRWSRRCSRTPRSRWASSRGRWAA